MSRPPALPRTSRHPSPTTLAAANAEQAAVSIPREAALQDGVLLVLSYEADNIFVLSSSSYEHVLDSALANFSALRTSRTERSQLRLALQTKLGPTSTLVYITPDTWPAVASRAKVVTVLAQRSSSPPSHPPPTHRVASPAREPEPNWPSSPPHPHPGPPWHPAYLAGYPPSASSPSREMPRPLAHSRQHSQTAHYPYAHMHYLPAPQNALSPTTDVSSLGVRLLTEAELRQERSAPAKRHWDQIDDAGSDERPYARPAPDTPAEPLNSTRSRDFALHEDRKPKRARAWNPPDHQYSCRRCQRTDSPAWRKGPDGPKTLCNACGLSYAKELARRDAAPAAPATTQPPISPPERPGYSYSSGSAAHSSRSARTTGVKTLDGSDSTLLVNESFSGPSASNPVVQRECTVCKRTDSPQWRKGPDGPNTLCNSCGLAWARTQRKSEGTLSRPGSSRSTSPTVVPPTYHQAAPPAAPPAVTPSGTTAARPNVEDEHMRSSSAGSHRTESPAIAAEL